MTNAKVRYMVIYKSFHRYKDGWGIYHEGIENYDEAVKDAENYIKDPTVEMVRIVKEISTIEKTYAKTYSVSIKDGE